MVASQIKSEEDEALAEKMNNPEICGLVFGDAAEWSAERFIWIKFGRKSGTSQKNDCLTGMRCSKTEGSNIVEEENQCIGR